MLRQQLDVAALTLALFFEFAALCGPGNHACEDFPMPNAKPTKAAPRPAKANRANLKVRHPSARD
jgi:hypothetical protein